MKVNLSFVPPGGGETDYSLEFELPGIPQTGDYITIQRGENVGAETFIVRRTWWNLEVSTEGKNGAVRGIWVECEFARWAFSSDDHKNACERYKEKTGTLLKFEETMY